MGDEEIYSSMRDSLVEDVSVCGTDKLIVFRPKKRFSEFEIEKEKDFTLSSLGVS